MEALELLGTFEVHAETIAGLVGARAATDVPLRPSRAARSSPTKVHAASSVAVRVSPRRSAVPARSVENDPEERVQPRREGAGDCLPLVQQYARAWECFRTGRGRELGSLAGSHPSMLVLRARSLQESAEHAASAEVFARLYQGRPWLCVGTEYYSTALWHLKRMPELATLSQNLLHHHRDAPETWMAVGNGHSLQGQSASALECYRRAIQLDASRAYAWRLAGHEHHAVGELEQGRRCLERAVQLAPFDGVLRASLAVALHAVQDPGAAVQARAAVALAPHSLSSQCTLALCLASAGDTKGALAVYDRAIRAHPADPLPRFRRAKLLFDAGEHALAVDELAALRRLTPTEGTVLFLQARALQGLRRTGEALRCLAAARDLDPDNVAIRDALEALQYA